MVSLCVTMTMTVHMDRVFVGKIFPIGGKGQWMYLHVNQLNMNVIHNNYSLATVAPLSFM